MRDKLAGNNQGQLLIEAMVAMGVISVGLLGVFSVLSNSLGISKITSNQYVGTYLAAEGIEVVKNIIDNNVYNQVSGGWNAGLVQNGGSPYTFAVEYDSPAPNQSESRRSFQSTDFLRFDSSTGLYDYNPSDSQTTFKRAVTVTSLDSNNELQVDSVVSWVDQGGTPDSVKLEDVFYNWR
ncbi:MAG: prepilin-type N-terminal cleavage/methylation domain-containing protein [Patescibacteria group bacterium]|nr:prepilin-type N-terminal cleavage/methylation domain-containing protein [Patescibacteria group bacterium]MCL5224165.1 prepilin-type N-terminal cleavage/methylation domain-containing protein [Patescibacteria group bacterium]